MLSVLVAPELTWTRLGDAAEGLVVEGSLVGVIYAEYIQRVDGSDIYELWWIPVADPQLRQVLFGVGDKAGAAWETRWDRARRAGEMLYLGYPGTEAAWERAHRS